jgi:hypothetical protein
MKKKVETFFLYLLFIIIRVINESKNVVEESLKGTWKEWASRFCEIFLNKF